MSSSILLGHARRRLLSTATASRFSARSTLRSHVPTRRFATQNAQAALATTVVNGNGVSNQENPLAWMKVLAGITAAGTVASQIIDNRKAECCGIAGVIGTTDHDARYVPFLF